MEQNRRKGRKERWSEEKNERIKIRVEKEEVEEIKK